MTSPIADLYNRVTPDWERQTPLLVSDFTACAFVLSLCEPIAGTAVLDVEYGEGYMAQQLRQRGARTVEGIDISTGMLAAAQAAEQAHPLGLTFTLATVVDLSRFPDAAFDLVLAVAVLNYLTLADTGTALREIRRVLRPEGRLVCAVPHPALPFLRPPAPPLFFDRAAYGYFSGREREFHGQMWRRDGRAVPVRCVHKTLADYFGTFRHAGFTTMPDVYELGVTDEHLRLDPTFFGPLVDQPLQVAFRLGR